MTTIMNQECVHEEVEYDGDLVSGSFVVIDHGLAWSDEPGVELVVRNSKQSFPSTLSKILASCSSQMHMSLRRCY